MSFLIFLIIFTVFAFSKCEIDSDPPIVVTAQGLVQGKSSKTVAQNNTYLMFQGIPYAEAPIGELRFEAPVPKAPWKGIYNATKRGNFCTQHIGPVEGSEDCLFLNVYVPKINETNFPVMVYIHDGGFTEGNPDNTWLGSDFFLDQDVIVVTFNYRLGIFGFLSTGDMVVPGNNGLKDQVLALKWVRNNIKNFGGNIEKVTIFGVNAGSVSVSYHMLSGQSKGLFQGAIMQSGVSLFPWALSTINNKINSRIAAGLFLNFTNSKNFVNDLKKINSTYLQLVAENVVIYFSLFFDKSIFTPTIEAKHDNAFISSGSYELLSSGNYTKVPCIIGFNSFESANLFKDYRFNYINYDINNTLLLPQDLNINASQKEEAFLEIKNKYFRNTSVAFSGSNILKFFRDNEYVRPIREFVRLISKQTPVYFYRFSYEGHLGNENSTDTGIGNVEEINYLWERNITEATLQDLIIRQKLIWWWKQFAKFGNPTPTVNAENVWKKTDTNFTYLHIGQKLEIKQFPESENMQFWDEFCKKYGNPPYLTY